MRPPPTPVEMTIPIMLSTPLPAPTQCSARVIARPSVARITVGSATLSDTTERTRSRRAKPRHAGMLTGETVPLAWSMGPALPMPAPTSDAPAGSAARARSATSTTAAASWSEEASRPVGWRWREWSRIWPSASTRAASTLVPPTSTARATGPGVTSGILAPSVTDERLLNRLSRDLCEELWGDEVRADIRSRAGVAGDLGEHGEGDRDQRDDRDDGVPEGVVLGATDQRRDDQRAHDAAQAPAEDQTVDGPGVPHTEVVAGGRGHGAE